MLHRSLGHNEDHHWSHIVVNLDEIRTTDYRNMILNCYGYTNLVIYIYLSNIYSEIIMYNIREFINTLCCNTPFQNESLPQLKGVNKSTKCDLFVFDIDCIIEENQGCICIFFLYLVVIFLQVDYSWNFRKKSRYLKSGAASAQNFGFDAKVNINVKWCNSIVKTCTLEYTEISSVFLTPCREWLRQQENQRNDICNNAINVNDDIQSHFYNSVNLTLLQQWRT
jgi:hypothetical protein